MFEIKIKDSDIGYEDGEIVNPRKRESARGIVLKDNKIALLYKSQKNEYKLPGGGVEKDDKNIEKSFEREVLEETGCEIEVLEKLGVTEEYKSKINFYQLSHVFASKVINDTHKLNLTEKEIAEGGSLIWVDLDEAIKLVENCFNNLKPSPYDKEEDVYSSKFIVKRDLSILKNYRETHKK